MDFTSDIINCLTVLKKGGVILYPTDTVWGLGCDATNEAAVAKIFAIKKRSETKSMIILVSNAHEVPEYCQTSLDEIENTLVSHTKPTTIIYPGAKNLANNLMSADGSIAIRIAKDPFCQQLISALGNPIVSTSSNLSGSPTPSIFAEIEDEIKNLVDYIVKHRQNDDKKNVPSSIIKINRDGTKEIIRK